MDHADHLNLIRDGIHPPGGAWAELGSGRGAFTLALADLLGPRSTIHSIDRDKRALHAQERAVHERFLHVNLHLQHADFTQTLDLPPLDGVLMANSLHYQPHPLPVLERAREYLKPGGRLVIVEYNITKGNYAVPHPVPYARFVDLAEKAGFAATRLLATRPSSSMREIYSALSTNPLP